KNSLAVIDEQAGRREIRQSLLQEQELDHSGPGIAGAGAKLALIIDRGTMRSKIDFCRQGCGFDPGAVHREVLAGQPRFPAIPLAELWMHVKRLRHRNPSEVIRGWITAWCMRHHSDIREPVAVVPENQAQRLLNPVAHGNV